jgi:hypothetical protein
MTVNELIAELTEYAGDTQVILFATETLDPSQEYTVIEPAWMVNSGIYSGEPAVYITDGS